MSSDSESSDSEDEFSDVAEDVALIGEADFDPKVLPAKKKKQYIRLQQELHRMQQLGKQEDNPPNFITKYDCQLAARGARKDMYGLRAQFQAKSYWFRGGGLLPYVITPYTMSKGPAVDPRLQKIFFNLSPAAASLLYRLSCKFMGPINNVKAPPEFWESLDDESKFNIVELMQCKKKNEECLVTTDEAKQHARRVPAKQFQLFLSQLDNDSLSPSLFVHFDLVALIAGIQVPRGVLRPHEIRKHKKGENRVYPSHPFADQKAYEAYQNNADGVIEDWDEEIQDGIKTEGETCAFDYESDEEWVDVLEDKDSPEEKAGRPPRVYRRLHRSNLDYLSDGDFWKFCMSYGIKKEDIEGSRPVANKMIFRIQDRLLDEICRAGWDFQSQGVLGADSNQYCEYFDQLCTPGYGCDDDLDILDRDESKIHNLFYNTRLRRQWKEGAAPPRTPLRK